MIRVSLPASGGSVRPLFILAGLLITAAGLSLVPAVVAAAPRSELSDFLGVLRQRGYADFAAEYLQSRKDDPALPVDLRETWNVEMANCLWIASSQTSNEQEAERRRQAAQGHLEAFLKEHPNHPAVAESMVTWGTTALEHGVVRIQLAKISAAEAEKEVHLKEARVLLTDAHTRLTKALEALKAQQGVAKPAAVKGPVVVKDQPDDEGGEKPAAPGEGKAPPVDEAAAELAFRVAVARFKLGLTDYWFAQTCDESQAADKEARLKSASDVFGEIYRAYRGELPGLIAYYWQARIMCETKNDDASIEDALEMADEVLTIAPDIIRRGEIDAATLSLIGDAMVLRMQLLVKSKQAEVAAEEASVWLRNNSSLQDTAAFHGIVIEWVKILMPNLDKIPDQKRRFALQKTMLTMLNRISRGRGPYQSEARMLLARLSKQQAGNKGQGDTFEDALAAAESAFIAEQWASAVAGYERAEKLLSAKTLSSTDRQKQEKQIAERLAQAQVQIAYGLARENQLEPATDMAERIIRENPKSSPAPAAAALALQTLQNMANDPKRDKLQQETMLKRWQALAENTLKTWPNHPEADEARFVLGQIALRQKNGKQALEMLTSVGVNSPRYPAAMLSAGHYAWRRYNEELAKPEKERNADVLKRTSESALKWLTASMASQRPPAAEAKKDEEREQARRKQQTELKLLLADVQTACGKSDEALATYQGLIKAGLDAKGATLDDATMRALGAALKANITRGDLDKASDLAVVLGKRVGDQPQINALLINVLRFLVQDLRKAEAATITAGVKTEAEQITTEELESAVREGNDAAKKGAAEGLLAARKRTGNLLAVLVPQNQHSATTMVYVAKNCIRVGMKAEGTALYQRILAEAAKRPDFVRNPRELTGPRAELIGLLSDKKQYAEALRQIDVLLMEHPKALDLLVQKAKIQQAWAKTDPAHYNDAILEWNRVRTMLAGMPKKPPEYYEAIYNTAECLIIKSQREKKPDSANQAEKLLTGTMVLDPQLNGPDTVARFNVLIKRAVALQPLRALAPPPPPSGSTP